MNDHFRRTLRDRYEVIYDGQSPTAMIPGAEASNAAIMITDGPAGPAELTRNWENSSVSALESMVSMTGYWNAYKLDVPL